MASAGQRALARYRAKRDFAASTEPAGTTPAGEGRVFVVQKHAARRLHYDLRLQLGPTLKSWAVAKGPTLDPSVRRLAVHVEDHPLDYANFEGVIPKGQYGAGAVIVWDRGTWVPEGDPHEAYEKGRLKFRLAGEKLKGGWSLVRTKAAAGSGDSWLLIKQRDLFARPTTEGDILEEAPASVLTGRAIEAVAEPGQQEKKPKCQRRLAADPAAIPGACTGRMPEFIAPQLATPAASPPLQAGWLHEVKFDGYRTLARLDGGKVRLLTRTGLDWTRRYGRLAMAFEALPCRQALIDGEIVVQDPSGLTNFKALQEALAQGATDRLTFFAFDLLYLDGLDLTAAPLLERKAALAALLDRLRDAQAPIALSEHVAGKADAFFDRACRMLLEGVVSKRPDAPYRPGRTRAWLKTKCRNGDDFVIVGYTTSEAAGGLAALLLGAETADGLRYVGKVGTGFSTSEAKRLATRLAALRQDTPTVALPKGVKRRGLTWVHPSLTAEVEYAERTAEGLLRQAAYKGLRPDKPGPSEAPRLDPTRGRRRYVRDADLAALWITNPDRVMFGAGGPTKLELALYYARVGDWMLPELLRRPVSIIRCPTGEAADCFYQRHAMPGMPDAVKQIRLREEGSRKRGDYLYLEDARGLLGLAQFGAVEFHPWGCLIDKPERPDRIVFDLDPDEGLPWRGVVNAAIEIRDALLEFGLVPFVKTTGGKGLHIVVPLARRQSWSEVHRFSEAFARRMARRAPTRFTATLAKRARRGRIFIDYLRNARSATAVAAYSLRARPGAPVSTPIGWDELRDLEDPRELNYATVLERLAMQEADPWAAMDGAARALTRKMERQLADRN